MTTAPSAEMEYSKPIGKPTAHSRFACAPEKALQPRLSLSRSVFFASQNRFSRPLSIWLSTVASAAPVTPRGMGTMSR